MVTNTDFELGQGETFKILLHISTEGSGSGPINVDDFNFSGQLRENYTTSEIATEFEITKILPYNSGSIFVEIPSTESIKLNQRIYVYDLTMADETVPPNVRRLLEGKFTIRPMVTR
jgi:hypothetical protein